MKNKEIKEFRGASGFPCRWEGEIGKHHENEFLYGLYYATLHKKEEDISMLYRTALSLSKFYLEVREQDYPNHIKEEVPEKEISHDQLTAYSCFSFRASDCGHKEIFKKIHRFKIDGRIQHPRDIIYFGLLNYRWWAFLLLPVLHLFCASSMLIAYRLKDGKLSKKLSGELLWHLRVRTVKRCRLLSVCMFPCNVLVQLGAFLRFGSIGAMFASYFNNEPRNPIVRLVTK